MKKSTRENKSKLGSDYSSQKSADKFVREDEIKAQIREAEIRAGVQNQIEPVEVSLKDKIAQLERNLSDIHSQHQRDLQSLLFDFNKRFAQMHYDSLQLKNEVNKLKKQIG